MTDKIAIKTCDKINKFFNEIIKICSNSGIYYVDHIRRVNQLDDPRLEWRSIQMNMVNNYLQQANGMLTLLLQLIR